MKIDTVRTIARTTFFALACFALGLMVGGVLFHATEVERRAAHAYNHVLNFHVLPEDELEVFRALDDSVQERWKDVVTDG